MKAPLYPAYMLLDAARTFKCNWKELILFLGLVREQLERRAGPRHGVSVSGSVLATLTMSHTEDEATSAFLSMRWSMYGSALPPVVTLPEPSGQAGRVYVELRQFFLPFPPDRVSQQRAWLIKELNGLLTNEVRLLANSSAVTLLVVLRAITSGMRKSVRRKDFEVSMEELKKQSTLTGGQVSDGMRELERAAIIACTQTPGGLLHVRLLKLPSSTYNRKSFKTLTNKKLTPT